MATEDIKIIIKKNGEIWVDLGGLEPQRVRHYKEVLEEVIGPIKGELVNMDGGAPPGQGRFSEQYTVEDEDENRQRIKNS